MRCLELSVACTIDCIRIERLDAIKSKACHFKTRSRATAGNTTHLGKVYGHYPALFYLNLSQTIGKL